METIPFKATLRSETGTRAARRLRAQGVVPGVLYGRGMDTVPLAVEARELLKRIGRHTARGTIVSLDIEGGDADDRHAIIRDVQWHPVTQAPLSVDFLRISLTERITVPVPIQLVGEPVGVEEGGVLDHVLREVEISVLPLEVPEALQLDVSQLQVGDSLQVRDIAAPEGVEILSDPDETVAVVVAPSEVEEAEEEVLEEEMELEEAGEEEEAAEEEAAEEEE